MTVRREIFDEDYLYFYADVLGSERSDADAELIARLLSLQPGTRVLDAPCGEGRIAGRLARLGCDVVGIDSSERFPALARERSPGPSYELGASEPCSTRPSSMRSSTGSRRSGTSTPTPTTRSWPASPARCTRAAMFATRGFDDVKVSEVAEIVGVSEKTVYNYFPTKESMVLDLADEAIERLAQALRERPSGETVTRAALRALEQDIERYDLIPDELHASFPIFGEMLAGAPSLRAAWLELHDRLAAVAAEELAKQAEVDPRDPEPAAARSRQGRRGGTRPGRQGAETGPDGMEARAGGPLSRHTKSGKK
jgi:AcrR family transcriptional regulator